MSQYMPPLGSPLPNKPGVPSEPVSPDDALPPVEPPSATFLIQLFVVPAVIVAAIVLVWLSITWIASRGDDPREYTAALKRSGPARWKTAANLAAALGDARHEEFKHDRLAATELAALLSAEVKAGSMAEDDVSLRQFLCKVLGEFKVDAGAAALIEAASTQREPEEVHVRRAAIESLAVLADNLAAQDPPEKLKHPQLAPTLLKVSANDDPTLRYTAAVALGVIGDKQMLARLREMLADADTDVRYNAALGLARHGDEAATSVLLQMLDPEQTQALESEKIEDGQAYKRVAILSNAMRAVLRMQEQNPRADFTELADAIERLSSEGHDRRTQFEAHDSLIRLRDAEKAAAQK